MNKIQLIKASAGSGKTHELMKRMSASIAQGTPSEGLLATTYTIKAAAELKSRIRNKLLQEGHPEAARRVLDGLIGTVNSVCDQLLREYAIDAGLSPALDVLPEENAQSIFAVAISDVIAAYTKKLNDVGDRLGMNPVKKNSYSEAPDWKEDVKKILDLARSNGLDKATLNECAEGSCQALRAVFPATQSLSFDEIKNRVKDIKDYPANAKVTQDTIKTIEVFLRFPTWDLAASLGQAKYAKRDDKGFPIEIFEKIGVELCSSHEFYDDLCAMIRGVFHCAGDALDAYEEYKQSFGLVDFIDQESKVLGLTRNNAGFAELLKKRLTQIMVDEFQDTSPIQLALFLTLNEFSSQGSLWVGDPKQAIYGFRGTDPELMTAATQAITDFSTLSCSWRSKENLVDLANEVFTRVFHNTPAAEVTLKVPQERHEKAQGGIIEAWHLRADNMSALAQGVAELIRDKKKKPSDIAVLFRGNKECADFVKALRAWNIQASAPAGAILETVECQLAMAAYRYALDPSDTVALATLMALYGETPGWLKQLQQAKEACLAEPKGDPLRVILQNMPELDFLKKLKRQGDETPLELLERVITLLDLDSKVQRLPAPDLSLSNLDELRRLCRAYMEQARVSRSVATPTGFAVMLLKGSDQQAAGFGENTVNVLTYHKAKGLEWPVVILGSLDSTKDGSAFGINVQQAEHFDIQDPLKDRKIHYWPNPLDQKRKFAAIDNALNQNPLQDEAIKRSLEEERRLFYVGLTRARDHLVLCIPRKKSNKDELKANPNLPEKLQHKRLDQLTETPIFAFPLEAGLSSWRVGDRDFELMTKIFEPCDTVDSLKSPLVFVDTLRPKADVAHLPARLMPSELPAEMGSATLLHQWAEQLGWPRCRNEEYDRLGNAFHNFFALNPQTDAEAIATRLLQNWQLPNAVAPAVMVAANRRLYAWLESHYPESTITCEVPVSFRNEHGQLLQGFIDMLLETPDGYVIIDHKTGIKGDAQIEAASHAAQLRIYRRAVEAATGKKVLASIIHLPLMGQCFAVS